MKNKRLLIESYKRYVSLLKHKYDFHREKAIEFWNQYENEISEYHKQTYLNKWRESSANKQWYENEISKYNFKIRKLLER